MTQACSACLPEPGAWRKMWRSLGLAGRGESGESQAVEGMGGRITCWRRKGDKGQLQPTVARPSCSGVWVSFLFVTSDIHFLPYYYYFLFVNRISTTWSRMKRELYLSLISHLCSFLSFLLFLFPPFFFSSFLLLSLSRFLSHLPCIQSGARLQVYNQISVFSPWMWT